MKNNLSILIFLFTITSLIGQEAGQKLIRGRVVSEGKSIAGADIVNLVNEQATTTDRNGNFQILAAADHLLIISKSDYEYNRYLIQQADVENNILIISLFPKAIQLEETVVNAYAHINAVDLGILQKAAKVYSPAERKLYAAQSGPVDQLVNMFTGKTEMRKKEVEVEKKEMLLERLDKLYDEKYYVEHLKIPLSRIDAFRYFAVEDSKLAKAVHDNDKNHISFNLGRIAGQFLQLVNED